MRLTWWLSGRKLAKPRANRRPRRPNGQDGTHTCCSSPGFGTSAQMTRLVRTLIGVVKWARGLSRQCRFGQISGWTYTAIVRKWMVALWRLKIYRFWVGMGLIAWMRRSRDCYGFIGRGRVRPVRRRATGSSS